MRMEDSSFLKICLFKISLHTQKFKRQLLTFVIVKYALIIENNIDLDFMQCVTQIIAYRQ